MNKKKDRTNLLRWNIKRQCPEINDSELIDAREDEEQTGSLRSTG